MPIVLKEQQIDKDKRKGGKKTKMTNIKFEREVVTTDSTDFKE